MPRRRASAPNAPPELKDAGEVAPDIAALLATALGAPLAANSRLAVAVSGGPDSLGLLWLAANAFPGRIAAITVDHGLRPAAAAEAVDVATLCAGLGVMHATLRWEGAKPDANIQAVARAARYTLMGAWCAERGVPLLLTAHHADDQAETLLMRLQRGSGLGGLAGIRPVRSLVPGVTLVRPLLGVRRAALARVVAAAGWRAIDDPANADVRFDRTAARALLAANPSLDVPALAAAAAHLAAAEVALEWATDRAWAGAARIEGESVALDVGDLPEALARRLVLRAIAVLAPAATPRGTAVAALQRRLAAGETATIVGIKVRGGRIWRFNKAPPRRKPA